MKEVRGWGTENIIGAHHTGKRFYIQRGKIDASINLRIGSPLVEQLGTFIVKVFFVPFAAHENIHFYTLVYFRDIIREFLYLVKNGILVKRPNIYGIDRTCIYSGLQLVFKAIHPGSV